MDGSGSKMCRDPARRVWNIQHLNKSVDESAGSNIFRVDSLNVQAVCAAFVFREAVKRD
jgi:hypothetical protein